MSAAGWANIVLSLIIGAFMALATWLLGSRVWFVWAIAAATMTSIGVAACQIASEYDRQQEESWRTWTNGSKLS